MIVRWTEDAAEDLRRIFQYIAKDDTKNGRHDHNLRALPGHALVAKLKFTGMEHFG